MPQPLSNQVPTAPETPPATLASQDEAQDEGLWMKVMRKSGHKKDASGNALSIPSHHGHGIPSNEPLPAAPSGVAEVPSHKISTTGNSREAPAELTSGIHELDIGSGQIYKPHTDANPSLGDLIPGQSSGPYANTSTSPLGIWDINKDVLASSVLESWTEEDRLKFGIHEGMDISYGLPLFEENKRQKRTAIDTIMNILAHHSPKFLAFLQLHPANIRIAQLCGLSR
ncbi:hypothetical protein H633G_10970 [Metarhizium anisopliae BRIP 53284]|nr:hypothetical protein H633G_10970 [Metarhizium anisopliae BRIP 53284]